MSYSNCCSETVSHATVEEDCIGGLIIEVFDDLNKAGADAVLRHGCPQSCMPNPVEGLLEVYEDMVEVLLVLEKLFSQRSLMLHCAKTLCCNLMDLGMITLC